MRIRDYVAKAVEKQGRWIVMGILALTVVFGYYAKNIKVRTEFGDLFPQKHLYVQSYNKFKKQFGSANDVFIAIVSKNGDIFTHRNLTAVRSLTEAVDLIPGVNHDLMDSLTGLSTRDIKISESGMVNAVPLIPHPIPTSAEDLETLKFRTYANPSLIGDLISVDGKGALIRAGFHEHALDYELIFSKIQNLRKKTEKEYPGLKVYVAGDPMLRGWLFYYMKKMEVVFALTIVGMVVLLTLYFRRVYGVIMPLFCAGVTSIWGVGFVGMLGWTIDPLMLVVPFLISARAVSHGVQIVERFYEEYEETKVKLLSAKNACKTLFVPGTVAALVDAAGILVVSTASFPMLVKLGIYGCFWAFAIVPTVVIFLPSFLGILPAPRRTEHFLPKPVVWYLSTIANLVRHRSKSILAVTVIVSIAAIICITQMTVGTEEVGSSLLFRDSDYNISAKNINERFAGTNDFQLYLEGDKDYAMLNNGPAVVTWISKYRNAMLTDPSVGGSKDVAILISSLNRMYHYNEPKWSLLPNDNFFIANLIFIFSASAAEPGVLNAWMNEERQDAAITMFVKDLKSDTLERLTTKTERFISENKLPEVIRARMAGGIVGLTAATNQEIRRSNFLGSILVIVVVFFLILLAYRSLFCALAMFSTLGVAMLITSAYMALKNIGLDIDTLPVICIGIGVGVDYAVYILDRIELEYKGDLTAAVEKALKTSGMAVSFTASTLIVGVIFWAFISPLRFQADMSLLVALLMALSMFSATTMMPALINVVKPIFFTKRNHF